MTSTPSLRALALTGALLCSPVAAQTERSFDLRQFAELEIGSPDGLGLGDMGDLIDWLETAAAEAGSPLPADVVGELAALDEDLLPLTMRVYLPRSATRRRAGDSFLCAIDTAGDLPIERWMGPAAMPGGAAGAALRVVELPRNRRRYLFGDELPRVWKLLRDGDLPEAPRTHRYLLRKVADQPMHLVLDLAGFVGPDEVRQLRALGGPRGGLVAFGLSRTKGRCNLDVHWGGHAGSGMVGALLPKKPEGAGDLHRLLPFRPGLAVRANLGDSFALMLRRIPAIKQMRPQDARDLVVALLDGWRGEVGVFQPDPGPRYSPPGFAPPAIQLSPEVVLLMRVDPERGESMVEAIARTLGKRWDVDEESGTVRFDHQHNSVHLGHRNGVLAICRTAEPETTAARIKHILSAAAGDTAKRSDWRVDRELEAPLQAWVSPTVARRLAEQLGDASDGGAHRSPAYRLGRDLARKAIATGYGVSITWDTESTRLRFRF